MTDFSKLKQAMGELDGEAVLEMINQLMAEGGQDAFQAMESCQQGMAIVGDHFESGEYFVGDLIYAGDLMIEAIQILNPALVGQAGHDQGRMILCTVEGDLHDIGKTWVFP